MIIKMIITMTVFLVGIFQTESSLNSDLKYKVSIHVTSQADENREKVIRSYIGRELRSLGDVDITEVPQKWKISIVTNEIQHIDGSVVGLVFYFSFDKKYDNSYIIDLAREYYKDKSFSAAADILIRNLKANTDNLYNEYFMALWFFGEDKLQDQCKKLVNYFDIHCLEPERTFRRECHKEVEEIDKKILQLEEEIRNKKLQEKPEK